MGIIALSILMGAQLLIRLDAERRHNAELREGALAAEAAERAMRVRAELLAQSNADLEQFACNRTLPPSLLREAQAQAGRAGSSAPRRAAARRRVMKSQGLALRFRQVSMTLSAAA